MALFGVNLLLNAAAVLGASCDLAIPPADAGETQAHGVILYLYPRSHTIDQSFDGCQNLWFLDDEHYRKLSVVRYTKGIAVAYDNIDLNNEIGYHCQYSERALSADSDRRCPAFEQLRLKTYQAGCYSQSKLDSSDSYQVASADCELK
jgi:hypothetical protein